MFTIATSTDGSDFHTIQTNEGDDLVFEGNTNGYEVVTNVLPEAVLTRYVRLSIVAFGDQPALRWAIDGCEIPMFGLPEDMIPPEP